MLVVAGVKECQVGESKVWHAICVVVLCCVLLFGCTDQVEIVKPLDVYRAGQVASSSFNVDKVGWYRFALCFVRPNSEGRTINSSEVEGEIKLWGDFERPGVVIPIYLKIKKDGDEYFERELSTKGVYWGQVVDYDGMKKNTGVRLIEYLELPPGRYGFEIRTLLDIEDFRGVESYVEVSYYSPKI